jgi:hypothetical protein
MLNRQRGQNFNMFGSRLVEASFDFTQSVLNSAGTHDVVCGLIKPRLLELRIFRPDYTIPPESLLRTVRKKRL